MSSDRRPCPELLATVPIRKIRAGLQFTCAGPTLGENGKDVWVCNSDGYVGQVCVLSLSPEPTVTSCNGVCNARILCIASVPGVNNGWAWSYHCLYSGFIHVLIYNFSYTGVQPVIANLDMKVESYENRHNYADFVGCFPYVLLCKWWSN